MKPNILFIIVDTFPSSKCRGTDKTSNTPNIDSLIDKGVYFNQAIASADRTQLSWASIFTGLYPFKTGLNGHPFSKIPTKANNYFNILNDYDYYIYATIPEGGLPYGLTYRFENDDVGYPADLRLHMGLGKKIIEKLTSKSMKEPWIYFIHLLDLHLPILLPKELDHDKYGNNQYDRMVSGVDMWIGQILKEVNQDQTLVVLTSDHGDYIPIVQSDKKVISNIEHRFTQKVLWKVETIIPPFLLPMRNRTYSLLRRLRRQFNETKFQNMNLTPYQKRSLLNSRLDPKRYLYDELVRVPLILSGYNLIPRIVTQQVRHIDILPTIAEIIGDKTDGKNIDGRSLTALIQGKGLDEKPVYMENVYEPDKPHLAVVGIRTSKYKYFRARNDSKNRIHLFDLEIDPFEENNIASSKPEIVKQMENILVELQKNSLPDDERESMSEDEAKKVELELRKMGYI